MLEGAKIVWPFPVSLPVFSGMVRLVLRMARSKVLNFVGTRSSSVLVVGGGMRTLDIPWIRPFVPGWDLLVWFLF